MWEIQWKLSKILAFVLGITYQLIKIQSILAQKKLHHPVWLTFVSKGPDGFQADWNGQLNHKLQKQPKHPWKQYYETEVVLLEHDDKVKDPVYPFLSLIQKYKLKKLLRITAYTKRFITNCSSSKRYQGVLITNEINQAETIWIKLPHVYAQNGTDLTLKPDESEILRCYGRVPNYHPVYIPRERSLA